MRKGSTSENVSVVLKPQLAMIERYSRIARNPERRPLASHELVVNIAALPRLPDNQPANVPVRGVGPQAFDVRENLRFVEGRRLVPGTREINVGGSSEIGTLRAPGFSRPRIVAAFLAESATLALVGGVIGCLLALPVHGLSTGTTNPSRFSEVAFKFRITPALLAGGLVFSAFMGAAGGLLSAIRAARIPVSRALREI